MTYLSSPGLSQTGQIANLIPDILQCVGYHHDPHVVQVDTRDLKHFGGESLAVPVDLLHGHVAHDRPLVALHRLKANLENLIHRLASKLFRSKGQHFFVRAIDFHLDLRFRKNLLNICHMF